MQETLTRGQLFEPVKLEPTGKINKSRSWWRGVLTPENWQKNPNVVEPKSDYYEIPNEAQATINNQCLLQFHVEVYTVSERARIKVAATTRVLTGHTQIAIQPSDTTHLTKSVLMRSKKENGTLQTHASQMARV